MGRQGGLYQTSYIKPAFLVHSNPQMLHMLQNQRKASEWSCNDQGGQPSVPKKEHMTHVTVTFSGTHEFLCRSKLNSFDDHGMCATPCRTVLLKQVQAMATATVELDRYEHGRPLQCR
jgi:hypothetical protein